MRNKLSIIFLTSFVTCSFAQTKTILADLPIGKWTLTRYTETFDGETYNRPIKGVKYYEPKTDSSYKEMNQRDSISVYELKSDKTFVLIGQNGKTIGKWKDSGMDSIVTLYDMQTFTSKGSFPKSNNTYGLKILSFDGLFLVLSSYDSGLKSTHKLYYKKTKED